MTEKIQKTRDVVFHIRRYDPSRDPAPYYKSYTVKVFPGMTVLEGLHEIKANQDQSLAWRYSCRMGVCGSCGMLLNGRPTLACNTQILDITKTDLTVAPLPNFAILRDLVPDLSAMFEKHRSLFPFILRGDREEMENPTGEYYQSPEEVEKYLQFSYCIKCGCCMAACPTLATDTGYLGPQPLAQSYRYSVDTRDGGFKERKPVAGGPKGTARCHYAGECSRACPKGVDPARAIQLMKRRLVLDFLHLARQQQPCKVQGPPKDARRRPEIPEAPAKTVGK